jgi:hypothetical protein
VYYSAPDGPVHRRHGSDRPLGEYNVMIHATKLEWPGPLTDSKTDRRVSDGRVERKHKKTNLTRLLIDDKFVQRREIAHG